MSDFIHDYFPGTSNLTVLSLHVTGGSEHDLVPLAQSLFPDANILSPRGKVSERGAARFFKRLAEGVFDLDDLRQQTDDLADFIASAAQKYHFDASNVWALGYSNGANIAASLLLQRSETLTGAVLLRAMTPYTPDQTAALTDKRIYLASGRFDPLVPVADIENLVRLFRSGGAHVELHLQNAGHELAREELGLIKDWIASE